MRYWNDPSPGIARLYLFSGAVFWSFGGLLIKEIDAGAVSIVFWRCFFSAILLAPLVRGRSFPSRPDSGVSIVIFALLLLLFVGATKETTAANAIFLQYTAPLWVIVFGPFILGERLRSRDAPAMAICLLGIGVLFAGNQGGDSLGLWLGISSGLFFGLFFLWLRRMRYADPIAITFISCLGVALVLSPVVLRFDVDARDLALLAVMSAFQFALPYVLFTKGLGHVNSAEASLIALVEPVLNPVWVALVFGENPSRATIIGGAIIIVGLTLRYAVFRAPEELAIDPAEAEAAH